MAVPKKPKIIFSSRYPPEFELIPFPGILDMIKLLSKKYEIIYFCMNWNKPLNTELRRHIKVNNIPFSVDITNSFDKWLKTALYYIYLPFSLMKISKIKPDIILCRENFPFVPYLLSFLKIPVLVEIGDWWPSMILGKTKFGKKTADFIENFEAGLWKKRKIISLTHTRIETEQMIKRGIAKDKIKRVTLPMYGGIYSPYDAKKEKKTLGFNERDFIVSVHGIIHPSKGYDQILEWWKKLVKIHPDWKLLVIGGTIGENWCKDKIIELGLEKNTLMTGWIFDQNKLNKYLNVSDCLLVTRRNSPETWGNTPSSLTHSLMTGKPVLATGLPGILEVIRDKENGFVYKPDDYKSFKNSLEFIYKYPKQSKEIGKKGLKRVKEYFDSGKLYKEYLEIISNLLKN